MGRPSKSPIWPFLLVVAFLFLLSILAPREWEHLARRPSTRAQFNDIVEDETIKVYGEPTLAPPKTVDIASSSDASASPPRAESTENLESAGGVEIAISESAAPLVSADQAEVCQPDNVPLNEEHAQREAIVESSQAVVRDRPAPILTNVRPRERAAASAEVAAPHPAVAPQEAEDVEQAIIVSDELERETSPDVVVSGPRWPEPVGLLRLLESLGSECECSDWAWDTEQLVLELCDHTAPTDERAGELIVELRSAASAVDAMVPQIKERSVAVELLRVRHALIRRLDVWELLPPLFGQETTETGPGQVAEDQLVKALNQLDAITRQAGAEGQQWRQYLALDSLRALTEGDDQVTGSDARHLSREVMSRLSREDLSESQRRFITSRPVADLAAAVLPWTLDPFHAGRLLADIERFEASNRPSDARRLADDYLRTVSLNDASGDLKQRLETNYRNANIRLALAEKLLKRLLPGESMSTDPVRDEILGLPTRGMSTTSTSVNVKLVPDDHRLRVALEASGQVSANTRSTSGPATLYTNSDSTYYARKVVDLDLRGIRTFPAESDCLDARTRLRSVSTDFDGVPLIGGLVESVARSRHAEQQDEVRAILRRKVEAKARQKMDSVAEERLANVNQQLRERVVEPLARMGLEPQVISAETSEQRLTMRVRLAGDEQLAGHTPRPRAPSDSLLSFQIHQSTFNNVCEALDVNGRTYKLPELRAHLIKALNLQNSKFMDETDKEVTITFADADAVRVRCEDGRIELNLAVARLTSEGRTWKNFVVRVYYTPQVEGLHACLVRDGIVQLIGSRLSSQIPLRGIFSKAFAKDRELMLVDPKWSVDQRTRDLAFSQFVIQDGWIAVAVSEPRDNLARRKDPRQAQ
jgi:hypothetical protein